ncbi:AAA family ATPase [Zobellella taiwanensis]|uniref:AAA family ATPase n=1 Tax=Zobellella taiwanensis TaxID=347535 RepID=UPI001C6255D6|nr:hypothetical protein [Zobellella taiwanensis]
MSTIKHLSISGFKSIRHLERLPLGSLNVLIGANGAGKSNFVDYFRMLPELIKGRLQRWSSKQGGAERILSTPNGSLPRPEPFRWPTGSNCLP